MLDTLIHYMLRPLRPKKRIGLLRRVYDAVTDTLEGEGEKAAQKAVLSKVFKGVQGGGDSIETWQTRKWAYDRYMNRFTLQSSLEVARVYGLMSLLERIKEVPGAVVECGVGFGKTLTLLAFGVSMLDQDREVFGFDSFAGFPAATADDMGPRVTALEAPGGWKSTTPEFIEGIFETEREKEESYLHKKPINLTLIPGFFEETIPAKLPRSIALLHVDCDLYKSTQVVLEHCLPRMTSKGVVILDEYNDPKWPGATKAVDEACAMHGLQVAYFPYIQRHGLRIP